MIVTLPIVFVVSLGVCLALTPVVRDLAAWGGLVDRPDRRRKLHSRPTPVGGGVAVLLAGVAGVSAAFLVDNPWREQLRDQARPLLGLLVAAVVIAGVGLLDDWGVLRGRHKVLGQVVAIGILMTSGLVVRGVQLFGWQLDLGLLAVPFTAFLLLGSINSLNLLDGMDGLLSTVGLIVVLAMAAMAVLGGKGMAACVAVALAGGLLGFLRYNRPPASIFLGDTGSMLIGLTVGVLAIQSSLKGPAMVALAAPLACLTIPIADSLAAILRRKLTGRSIMTTDRGHLHHCLLRRGLSAWGVLGWVSVLCLLAVVGALACTAFNNELFALLSAASVVGILVGVRLFGHAEFLLVRQRGAAFFASFLRFRSPGKPVESAIRLQGSADWKRAWSAVTACAGALNLRSLCLDVNAPALHEDYHARWSCRREQGENPGLWSAEIPLMVGGQAAGRVEVTGHRDDQPVWEKIAILTKLVEGIEERLAALAEQRAHPVVGAPHVLGALERGPVAAGGLVGNHVG